MNKWWLAGVIVTGLLSWAIHPASAQTVLTLRTAEAEVKSDPDKVWEQFNQLQPTLTSLPVEQQIGWYKVAVTAANNRLDLHNSLALNKQFYQAYWSVMDREQKAFSLAQLARHASIRKAFDQALSLFQCANQQTQELATQISMLNGMAIVYTQQEKLERAEFLYQQALTLAEKSNLQRQIAAINNNLGRVWFIQNKHPQAFDAFRKSYVIKTRLGTKVSQLLTLHNMMHSIAELEDWAQWEKYAPLYKRLLNEAQLPELEVQSRWLEAFYQSRVKGVQLEEPKAVALIEASQVIQDPVAINATVTLAKKLGVNFTPKTATPKERDQALDQTLANIAGTCSNYSDNKN